MFIKVKCPACGNLIFSSSFTSCTIIGRRKNLEPISTADTVHSSVLLCNNCGFVDYASSFKQSSKEHTLVKVKQTTSKISKKVNKFELFAKKLEKEKRWNEAMWQYLTASWFYTGKAHVFCLGKVMELLPKFLKQCKRGAQAELIDLALCIYNQQPTAKNIKKYYPQIAAIGKELKIIRRDKCNIKINNRSKESLLIRKQILDGDPEGFKKFAEFATPNQLLSLGDQLYYSGRIGCALLAFKASEVTMANRLYARNATPEQLAIRIDNTRDVKEVGDYLSRKSKEKEKIVKKINPTKLAKHLMNWFNPSEAQKVLYELSQYEKKILDSVIKKLNIKRLLRKMQKFGNPKDIYNLILVMSISDRKSVYTFVKSDVFKDAVKRLDGREKDDVIEFLCWLTGSSNKKAGKKELTDTYRLRYLNLP